LGMFTFPVW